MNTVKNVEYEELKRKHFPSDKSEYSESEETDKDIDFVKEEHTEEYKRLKEKHFNNGR